MDARQLLARLQHCRNRIRTIDATIGDLQDRSRRAQAQNNPGWGGDVEDYNRQMARLRQEKLDLNIEIPTILANLQNLQDQGQALLGEAEEQMEALARTIRSQESEKPPGHAMTVAHLNSEVVRLSTIINGLNADLTALTNALAS